MFSKKIIELKKPLKLTLISIVNINITFLYFSVVANNKTNEIPLGDFGFIQLNADV